MHEVDGDGRTLLSAVVKAYPDAVWFADVDDTLVDTVRMHNEASSSIVSVLGSFVGDKKAYDVVRRFEEIFEILIESHQSSAPDIERTQRERDDLLRRIAEYQQEIKARWRTTKKFSRETLLKIAGEDYGIDLTSEQIRQCIDHYWQHVLSHPLCFDDAIRLTQMLAKVGLPLFLMTSSDGRLTLNESGQFDYDPVSSRRFKEARVQSLRAEGLHYREVFVGDPIDKPTREFFQFVYDSVERHLGRRLNPQHTVVIGDSYTSDLQIPVSEWKVGLGVLYRPGQEDIIVEQDRVVSVGDWNAVGNFLFLRLPASCMLNFHQVAY
jgi:FMN phosphatase YigB (HAD superfamily)